MSSSVCPIATVNTPVERVWRLLSEPASYALWWNAQTCAIVPEGTAQPGQKIYAQATALGKRWNVTIVVEAVDTAKRQIHLTTTLPLGITVYNHITCTPLDSDTSRVSFG